MDSGDGAACRLYTYSPAKRLVAVESGAIGASDAVLFIGGLGDGLNATPFIEPLARRLATRGWAFVQVLTSSSGPGWGTGSVQRDAAEILDTVRFFRDRGRKRIVLLGHSTGCQDAVQFFASVPKADQLVDGVILQAPVSDREAMAHDLGRALDAAIATARALPPYALMPRQADDPDSTPITAARFLSLYSVGGDEDFFSSDLPDVELRTKLGVLSSPVAFLISGEDEYMHVDKARLLERFVHAARAHASPRSAVIAGASHSIVDQGAQTRFLDVVDGFLGDLAR